MNIEVKKTINILDNLRKRLESSLNAKHINELNYSLIILFSEDGSSDINMTAIGSDSIIESLLMSALMDLRSSSDNQNKNEDEK